VIAAPTGERWGKGKACSNKFVLCIRRTTQASIYVAALMIPRVLSAQDVAHCEQVVRFTQSFAVTLDSMKRLQLAASRWQSTTPDFAGTMDCSIDADEQLSCAEAWVLDGKPAAERAKAVSKTIVRCLGREWQSTARRLGDDRAALIIWRPDLRVEFEVGLQSREVVVRQESADSTTVLGEAPKTTLEWRHSLLITGLKAPTTNAATMAWQSDANRLCEDVRAVVASARDDFSSIKKAKNSNDTWSTDIQAHGFGGCDVRRNYYSCESEPVDSLSQLRAGQDALAASLTACLGNDWRSARRAYGDATWVIYLTESTDRVSAEIRTRRTRTGDLRIILDINSNAP
jgi:hypothetical protein